MAPDDTRKQLEERDPLAGAVEHDGTEDGYERFSEEVDEALGLDGPGTPIPGDEAAGDDAMP